MSIGQGFKRAGCASLVAGLLSASGLASAQVVSVVPSPSPAIVGSTMSLDVLIAGVADLYAYQFNLAFNPSVLQAIGFAEGAFLPSAGTTIFDPGALNNTLGTLTLSYGTLVGPGPGASGSGVLTAYNFNVVGPGVSALTLSNVILLNSNLDTISAQISSGSVTAVPEPSTYAMFALGLAGLAAWRLRKAA
jgi:general secretion pathway protein D